MTGDFMISSRKKLDKKGFTLVEMIVVLVITVIIASLALGGLTMYQRYAAFKQNNSYAQTIFAAAQASFSRAKASGQLEELREELKSDAYKENELSQAMVVNGAKFEKRTADGGLYFLCYERGKDKSTYSKAEKMLHDLLKDYVYDGKILDATYCVEFDAVDGTVLGVCYSDKAKDFAYNGGSTTDAKGKVNITDRKTEARREVLLGYYGVENVSARASQESEKAFIDELQLINDETLYVKWSIDENATNLQADLMQYEFQLCRTKENGDSQLVASFIVNDSNTANNALPAQSVQGANVTCSVKVYDEAGENVKDTISYKFPAYKTADYMVLALDAVDIEAERILSVVSEEAIKPEDAEVYKETYSIRRLIDSPEDIYVKVQAFASGEYEASTTAWSESNKANAYFEKATLIEEKTKIAAEIKNARHLFNVRFTEANENAKPNETADVEYTQIADLNWSGGIVANGNVYEKTQPNSTAAFPVLATLASGNTYDGGSKKLNEFTFLSDGKPIGLFGVNKGTITNLTIENSSINSPEASYVGLFCGVNGGTLSNLTADASCKVSGGNFVGGIAGSDGYAYADTAGILAANGKRSYAQLVNNAKVTGGSIDTDMSLEQDKSTASQPNPEIELKCNYAGGIVGYINGTYFQGNSSATDQVQLRELKNNGNIKSSYAANGKSFIGGIAGYTEYVDFDGCINSGSIEGKGTGDANGNAVAYTGGIVGYAMNGNLTNCSLGDNGGTVTADYGNVGGIVGKYDSGDKENSEDYIVIRCNTGEKWTIRANKAAKNAGCGGIIGLNMSSAEIGEDGEESVKKSITNKATVVVADNDSALMGIGGIIGVQNGTNEFEVSNCQNTGTISGFGVPGGIIGRVTGAKGSIEYCVNSGTVTAEKAPWGGGGIVGNVDKGKGKEIEISDCKNEAKISGDGRRNAGILASITGGNEAYDVIEIEDCINTGAFDNTTDNFDAGILAYSNTTVGIINITGCKNYGLGNQSMCGITTDAVGSNVNLTNNFGVASCGIPIAPTSGIVNVDEKNYYFSELRAYKETTTWPEGFVPKKAHAEIRGKLVSDANEVNPIVDGDFKTQYTYNGGKTPLDIIILFDKKVSFVVGDTIDFYWAALDNGVKEYQYELYFLTNSNEKMETDNPINPTSNGKPTTYTGVGYADTSQIAVNRITVTQEPPKVAHGIAIRILGHNKPDDNTIALYEMGIKDKLEENLSYVADVNISTKGTPLGVTEKVGSDFYAANPEKGIRIRDGMLINPLELRNGNVDLTSEEAYGKLEGSLIVVSGNLTETELSTTQVDTSKSGFRHVLNSINNGIYDLVDTITPPNVDTEKPPSEDVESPDNTEPDDDTGEVTTPEQPGTTPPEQPADPEKPTEPNQPTTPDPEKKELLKVTETVLADSEIPQTALSWQEEEYVKTYDLLLDADQNERLHYTLSRRGEGAKDPYQILKETDKLDDEGNVIWEEMATRKDEKYPKTETLSNGTKVTTYYYPLGYTRTIDGVTTEEQERAIVHIDEDGNEVEEIVTETVEVPCQTTVEAYLECKVFTTSDGTVSRTLYLVLPDIETEEGIRAVNGTEDAYRFTNDILITNQAVDETLYEAPKPLHWWRETDDYGFWITKMCEQGKESEYK